MACGHAVALHSPFAACMRQHASLVPCTHACVQVRASSKAALQRSLGDKSGTALWLHAHGVDNRAVELPKAGDAHARVYTHARARASHCLHWCTHTICLHGGGACMRVRACRPAAPAWPPPPPTQHSMAAQCTPRLSLSIVVAAAGHACMHGILWAACTAGAQVGGRRSQLRHPL